MSLFNFLEYLPQRGLNKKLRNSKISFWDFLLDLESKSNTFDGIIFHNTSKV